jgi:hypothetical protein
VSSEDVYCRAESEDGTAFPDPSEDAIYLLAQRLDDGADTFFTVEPTDATEDWYVSISKLSEGGFEVEFRDAATREHTVTAMTEVGRIAREATLWIAGRPAVARRRAQGPR